MLKLKKATKHERKNLLKLCCSTGAYYPTEKTIVVDTTQNKETILLTIIHELGHGLGMNEKQSEDLTNKAMALSLKK
jgi:predicted Zn-dependent protease